MKFYKNILILGFLLLVGCAGYQPPKPAPLVAFKPALQLKNEWSHTVGKGTAGTYLKLTPVIANGAIFANANGGEITAFDLQTGRKIWNVKTRLTLTTGLAAADNMLFVGTDKAQIVALKQADGNPGWWGKMSSEVLATPVAVGKKVIAKDESGVLRAFSTDGKLLWSYAHQEPELILRGSSSPRIFGNYVVAGFASGKLVKLNLRNGSEVWSKTIAEGRGSSDVQRMVDIDVSPKVVNGIIYVATYQGKIAAVRLKTGQILWQHKLSSYSGLAVAKGYVYVTDDAGEVWAFDAKTGVALWRQSSLLRRDITAPAEIGNAVVVGDTEGYLHFMAQEDGHFIGRVRITHRRIIAAPLVYRNAVYVYAADGTLAKITFQT